MIPVVLLGFAGARAAEPAPAPGDIVELTITGAIQRAVERNPGLTILRLEPEFHEADALEERAVFAPLFEMQFGFERVRARDLSSSGILFDYRTQAYVGEAALTQALPTGTSLVLGATSEVVDASRDGQQLVGARVGAVLSQSLLRGASRSANLGLVAAARLEARAAQWEAVVEAELLATLVEQAGWDHALALRKIAIYNESLARAADQLALVKSRVEAGALAQDQVVAAESEVALRRQELVDARAELETARALLGGYLDLYGREPVGPELRVLADLEEVAAGPSALDVHVAAALGRRPEVMRAQVLLERGSVEVARARNGLRPRVDLFVAYNRTGYGEGTGSAWHRLGGDHSDVMYGAMLEYAFGGRAERAEHRRALAGSRTAEAEAREAERLAQFEVRAAHAEAVRARDKIAAVRATRVLDEEKERVERERFDLGLASAFQVARAQRDLVERRIDEVTAMADYRKALAELYRADGSLLERHGVRLAGPGDPTPEGP
ncbi:MAG: TolC family protein [Acidobacteria bacterium]|nr:TolC family protein [Acidobacteriota bacterium]